MTSRNPYAPPNVPCSEPVADVAVVVHPPRPIAVWLMLATLATMFAVNFVAIGRAGQRLLLTAAQEDALVDRIGDFGMHVGLFVILAFLLFAIHRRWPAGRWMGLAVMGLLAGIATVDAMSWLRTRGDLAQCVIEGSFGLGWAYAFAFSRKARRYFAPADVSGS